MLKYFVIKYLRKLGKKNIINGQNFVGLLNDRISIDTLVRGGYEKEVKRLLVKNFLSIKRNVALDIGAHIGSYTSMLSLYFNKVYAFEPNKTSFELLKINTRKNNNVKIFNLFLSNKNSKIKLETNALDSGNAFKSKLGKEIVRGVNTMQFFNKKKIRKIDFIKIDTEGHEFEILKNMHTLIKKYKPIIQIEVLDSEYSKNSYPKTIKYLKNELNYKYFYIPNNPIKIRRRNLILKEYYNLKYFFNNLLFFKEKLILIEKFENISYPAIFCTNYKIRKNN